MTIQFWTIGRAHESYVESGVTDFTKRINNYFPASWKLIASPRNTASLSEEELKRKEAEAVLKSITAHDYLVVLDERGKQLTSQQLATFIQKRANESVKQVIFLIGGAYGIDNSVIRRANTTWSLSDLTFPHQLVRLILAEQVYRACTIIRNEKYHHG
jgi:23S rRNA (pseudouridine1915-N3)-methyltransferase